MSQVTLARTRETDAIDQGLGFLHQGRVADAIRVLGRVARNNILDADAQHAYGLALHASWRFEESLAQFQRADRLKPRQWQVWQNIGAAYHGLRRYQDAHDASLVSLRLNPDNATVLYHLGDVHLIWGEMAEAADYYRQSLEVDPNLWDTWVGLLFCQDLIPEITAEQALAERRRFADHFETQLSRYRRPYTNTRDHNRKLNIGFISGDFRDHTAAYMFGPIYEHLDRDRFTVFSYADLIGEDSVGQWFHQASNGWRNIQNCARQDIDRCIREDQIDILIDTAGYTSGGHLIQFAAKPAPIQVQAWGYLTGSGLSTMDYILVDDVLVPPEHEAHFSERMLRVPYALGFQAMQDQYAVPILPRPEGRPLTFGHLGRADKISSQAIELWAETMRAYPESRMLLKDRNLDQERTRERVLAGFARCGIAPDRLDIQGRTDRVAHLAAYNEVDVILDSLPQGGGTTTMEALWMGTPVLTMLGPRIISRIAGTTLSATGHNDWIAPDRAAFIRQAGGLVDAGGPQLRDEISQSIVCDGATRTRHFEDALRVVWRQWCETEAA